MANHGDSRDRNIGIQIGDLLPKLASLPGKRPFFLLGELDSQIDDELVNGSAAQRFRLSRESREIAAVVDQFPLYVRELLRDSTLRVVEVYETTKERIELREGRQGLPSNVIPFPRLRRSARKSTRGTEV